MTLLRRLGALSLILWPAVHFAGFVTGPPGKTHDPEIFRTHATSVQVSAVLLHWGAILIVPVTITLASLVYDRLPRFAVVAGIVGAVAAINGSGLLLSDFYDLALAQSLPDAQAAAITDLAYGYPGVVFGFLLPGFLLHPALIALVAALATLGRAAWWQLGLLIAGLAWPFLANDQPPVVQSIGPLLIAGALVPIGARMLRPTAPLPVPA
ncbi:hypothetical protein [Paractinoplanes atraurantiacus]|uniref:DUF4386 family protein n=1 Tax=Paractinoplanes atraurantiacus TaxID=1036182 RepID=A0A285JWT7_9ACTN|nr:hypothetical protein [Actinoplanes atraurantiacus]SNY64775.1 hypothetical protein SAMN05421748_12744 [Actinoplanes atraurantiacus]